MKTAEDIVRALAEAHYDEGRDAIYLAAREWVESHPIAAVSDQWKQAEKQAHVEMLEPQTIIGARS